MLSIAGLDGRSLVGRLLFINWMSESSPAANAEVLEVKAAGASLVGESNTSMLTFSLQELFCIRMGQSLEKKHSSAIIACSVRSSLDVSSHALVNKKKIRCYLSSFFSPTVHMRFSGQT